MKNSSIWLSLICGFTLSCTSPLKTTQRIPTAIQKPKLTYPVLVQYLKDHQITRISDLVEALAVDFPSQIEDFALAYNSLSLHESSFRNPRVLLYGPDATLFLTYNGHPSQRAYSKLEIMHKESGGQYYFREISLKGDGSLPHKNDPEIELREQNFTVSKANIAKCTRCHGTPARPIWEPYAIWPGIFGSLAETTFDSPNSRLVRNTAVKDISKDIEREGLSEFLKYAPQNDRYKRLAPYISIGNGYRPLADLTVKLYNSAIEDLLDVLAEKMKADQTKKAVTNALCGPYQSRTGRHYDSRDEKQVRAVLADIYMANVDRFSRIFFDYKKNLRTLEVEKSECLPLIQSIAANSRKKVDEEIQKAAMSETSSECALTLSIVHADPVLKAANVNLRDYSMTMSRSLEFESGGSFMNSTLNSLPDLIAERIGEEKFPCPR